MKKKILLLVSSMFLFSTFAGEKKQDEGVKYKKSKKIDFESLLIQGDKRKAEIFVVTGDADDDLAGLLRLRENFLDHQAQNFGEEVK